MPISKKQKFSFSILSTVLLGIAMGFAGELMPGSFQTKIEKALKGTSWSYETVWVILVVVLTLLTLILMFRQSKKESDIVEEHTSKRVITQTGKNAAYIEKNEGGITIN